MKKLSLFCLILLGILSLLTGCQEPRDSQSINGSGQGGGSRDVNDPGQADIPAPADWQKDFLAGPPQKGESLYAAEYLNLKHGTPEDVTALYTLTRRVSGDRFYTLCEYNTEQGGGYYLDVHAPGKGKPEQTIELAPQQWELPEGSVISFDTAEEGYVFLLKTWAADEEGAPRPLSLQMVSADSRGHFRSRTDLTVLLPAEQSESILEGRIEYYRDGEGYSYLCAASDTLLLVLDREGNLVTQYSCPVSNPNQLAGNSLQPPARDRSGRLVFPVLLGGEKAVRLLGREGNAFRELAVLDEYFLGKWCGMYGNRLYYTANYNNTLSLMCWDVATGLRESVLDLDTLGITSWLNVDLIPEGEQKLRLRSWSGNEDYVITLSDQKPDYKDAVTVAALYTIHDGEFLSSTIARFTRENPLSRYTLELDQENPEAYRTRVMADIMAGGGPDILSVSREDMALLAEKGALLPIDRLVSQETLDALLPGILQEGTLGQDLMGIAVEASVNTLITSANTWPEENWTLDDFLALAKEKEGLEGLITGTFGIGDYYSLFWLVGSNLKDSRFLDMENGVSRFEQENFMEVLEIIKRFSGASTSLEKQYEDFELSQMIRKKVKEGAFLAQSYSILNPGGFPDEAGVSAGWSNAVGFPCESGSGSYIHGYYIMAVNANTKHPEETAAFLEYLLSFENQATLTKTLSVRGNMADRLAVSHEYNGKDCVAWNAGGTFFVLPNWRDVTGFKEAYNAFMQGCVPLEKDEHIFDIVWDEAQYFFSGEKDALTVTRLIDNRVQNYLDE